MRRILAWCREWQALFGFLCMIFALIGLFPETKLSIPLQQLPEVFSPWLYVVMALIGALLLFLHIAPTLRSGADWLFVQRLSVHRVADFIICFPKWSGV